MPTFNLTVNGAPRTVDVAAGTPLIYVLRGDLQLSGTRLGCGMSQCGACAVLADGKGNPVVHDAGLAHGRQGDSHH